MKKNVLIIEDEPIIAEMMSIILEEGGFNVISLGETGLARQKLHNQEVDIVMLDLNLVGEDGHSMCTYIKSQESLKDIPVILVSANHDIEKIMTDCGADDFIKKPFDIDDFYGKVHAYLPLSA